MNAQFGGGRGRTFHFSRRHPTQETGEPRSKMMLILMQVLPLLLLLFTMAGPSLFGGSGRSSSYGGRQLENQVFSMHRSNSFPTARATPAGASYFVSSNYDYRYGQRTTSLIEEEVNSVHLQHLVEGCEKEKGHRDAMLRKAKDALSNKERVRLLKQLSRKHKKRDYVSQCSAMNDFVNRM